MTRGPAIELGATEEGRRLSLPARLRATHMQVVGASSKKFLEHLIHQDIVRGQGLCVIDPHGTLYNAVARWCATHRLSERRKIHLFDPSAEG